MFIVGKLSFNFYGRVLEREGGMGDWEKNYLGQFVDLFKYFHRILRSLPTYLIILDGLPGVLKAATIIIKNYS